MNKEELYEDDDAYIKIIDLPNVIPLVRLLFMASYKIQSFEKNDLGEELNNKTDISYSYTYYDQCELSIDNETLNGRGLTLECSDSRRLIIKFANSWPKKTPTGDSVQYVELKYYLSKKTMTFLLRFKNYNYDSFDDIKIKFYGFTFNNSYLDFYKSIAKYNEKEIANKAIKILHKIAVDELLDNVFTKDELNMFYKDFGAIVYEELEKEEEKIYRALVRYS